MVAFYEAALASKMSEISYPSRELSRLHYLFDNDDPDQVWANAQAILSKINPNYELSPLSAVFQDVVSVFYGEYPGYQVIKTPYHDLRHTMDVFMCALRLMHGMCLSGEHLCDEDISIIAIATLMHDIGYAQRIGEDGGTGAQFTKMHVYRGIDFMRGYFQEQHLSSSWAEFVERTMLCTNPALKFSEIDFPNPHVKMIGKLVGTADLVGQMADRSYLEKLLFLFFEFREAHMGDFKSMQDLLKRTGDFYGLSRKKLDEDYEKAYQYLEFHFQDWFGVSHNYYIESMEKNIAFISKIVASDEDSDFFHYLKRRGIVQKAQKYEEILRTSHL
jgi:hypothetical protein